MVVFLIVSVIFVKVYTEKFLIWSIFKCYIFMMSFSGWDRCFLVVRTGIYVFYDFICLSVLIYAPLKQSRVKYLERKAYISIQGRNKWTSKILQMIQWRKARKMEDWEQWGAKMQDWGQWGTKMEDWGQWGSKVEDWGQWGSKWTTSWPI